jgi:GntR family transcriptional regulator
MWELSVLFRVDAGSGVPIYRQLIDQVRREVILGRLGPGDQLPSLTEVVAGLSINPNTVVKAYSELEHQGFVVRRQGTGTFVAAVPPPAFSPPGSVRRSLDRWVTKAREAGLSDDQIRVLLADALDGGRSADGAERAGVVA